MDSTEPPPASPPLEPEASTVPPRRRGRAAGVLGGISCFMPLLLGLIGGLPLLSPGPGALIGLYPLMFLVLTCWLWGLLGLIGFVLALSGRTAHRGRAMAFSLIGVAEAAIVVAVVVTTQMMR